MKKSICFVIFFMISFFLFAQVTDGKIRQAAIDLNVPYEALKKFVDSYQVQNVPSGIISIDAQKLAEEYTNNEIRANSQYKDKSLRITGKIRDIGIDSGPNYYFEFEGFKNLYVRVRFKSTEESKLGNFSNGQTVTVVGNVGKIFRPWLFVEDSVISK